MSDTNINADGKTTEDAFEDDEEEASENSDTEDKFSDMENESEGDEEDLEFKLWAWMPDLNRWPMQSYQQNNPMLCRVCTADYRKLQKGTQ